MRTLVILMLVLAIPAMAVALEPSPTKTTKAYIGGKLGFNVSGWTGDDVDDFDAKSGVILGGFVCFAVVPQLGFQGELLITEKGAEERQTEGGVTMTATVALTYVEIPILAKAMIPIQNVGYLHIYAGPAFSILTSAKLKIKVEGGSETYSDEEDMKKWITDTDIGLILGGGIDFNIGPGVVVTDARFTFGMQSIDNFPTEGENGFSGSQADVNNTVISFMVGYAIGIGN